MTERNITTKVFPSGLRLIAIDLPYFHSFTTMALIRSGSRYETPERAGIAHFLEHLVFKGTKKYPSSQAIAEAVEGIGGYFNAWTASDHTSYWSMVPEQQWYRGVEVVLELAFASAFTAQDLERERGVIIEEIRRNQDDPSSYVDDLATELLFAGHPLGAPVIGSEQTVSTLSYDQVCQYRTQFYSPSQVCVICAGAVAGKHIEELLESYTSNAVAHPAVRPEPFLRRSQRALKILTKPTDQTHLVLAMASPLLAMTSAKNHTANVLATILGRGMSSRLFLKIREQHGLAYAIGAQLASFEDTGAIFVDGGVTTAKAALAVQAIEEELDNLQQQKVTDAELRKAKSLLIGSYDMSADRPIDLARWYGTGELLEHPETIEQARSAVKEVTPEHIQQLAQQVFRPDARILALIGPHADQSAFPGFLQPE